MRKEYIVEMLDEACQTFDLLKNYQNVIRPKVKNILENLRSSLDYLANDINEKLSVPSAKKFYFPYAETKEDFDKKVKKDFPLLQAEQPDIYSEMLKVQPFGCNDDWLVKMCLLTNDIKHNNPLDVRHSSEVVKSVAANIGNTGGILIEGDCSGINVIGNHINGKRTDDFTYNNGKIDIIKKGDIAFDFIITKDKKILVGDEYLDIFPFLEKCINNLRSFIDGIYIHLN